MNPLLPPLLFALFTACSPPSNTPSFAYTTETTNGALPPISWGSSSGSGSDDTSSADTGDTADTADDTEVVGTGYAVGDIAYDLQATSQFGNVWSLADQRGQAVLLLVGNADVGSSLTTPLSAMGGIGGVQSVLLLGRNEYSTLATREDAARYAAAYGVDIVLIDPFLDNLVQWGGESTPRLYLIGPDRVIRYTASGAAVNAATLPAVVQDLL